ncbi:hypothetical protein G9A89_019271 [Geosiphon pyriformis]|nr:hypothetical protein G9A89_019271 [Geosiphon pyriformis]
MEAFESKENQQKKTSLEKPGLASLPKSDETLLYKPPTNEEIQELKAITDLYKSNLFKLKVIQRWIDEVLSEVKIDYEKVKSLEYILEHLKQVFDNIPDYPEASITQIKSQMRKKHKIIIPFPEPPPKNDIQYKFGFKKPTSIHLIGSYPLNTVARSRTGFNLDVAVVMPSSLFQEKDYLNYRYFYKRAYYLSVLAVSLKPIQTKININVEFSAHNGDRRRPILVIRPLESIHNVRCMIRIFLCIPPDLFPIRRLAPSRNNVRPPNIEENDNLNLNAEKDSANIFSPTPQYNLAILQDAYFIPHLLFLHQQNKVCPAFKDACLLAKVWLNQRGIGSDKDGEFNGFLWTMLMAFLLDGGGGGTKVGKRLGNGFSSYQLIKGTMEFLANHDFIQQPIFMNESELNEEFSAQAFTENFDVVFVDKHCRLNLFGGLSRAKLDQASDSHLQK